MQTYLFYDIETTGLNKAFDQVLQFAAIRTDLSLNELERYELKVKLNPDIIPAPQALITHRIGIKESQEGLSEFDAIKKIHTWMNTPGTISLGYNTLSFDDEFLRFSFYRNLLSPYTHQFANQCGRMDIFPIAALFFLFKNEVIKWPLNAEGQISLKLEMLNAANAFVSGPAHNAMVDVEATLALANCFFGQREMWDYVTSYFNKQTDQARSQQPEALMVYSKFGSAQAFQSPVLFLGNHRHYRNQQLWLRLDVKNFADCAPADFEDFKLVANKKLGEPGFTLPFIERFLTHLNSERRALTETNKKWLAQHQEVFQKIANYHAEFKFPTLPETDVEASLYLNGFWSDEENFFCKRFHSASPAEKASMTENIKNPRLKALATRVLGRHFPDALTPSQTLYFEEFTQQAERDGLIDYRGEKRLNRQTALQTIATLLEENTLEADQINLLSELREYCK